MNLATATEINEPAVKADSKISDAGRMGYLLAAFVPLVLFLVWVNLLFAGEGNQYEGRARADILALETSIIRYRHWNGELPSRLDALVRRPSNAKPQWRPLLMEQSLVDPWEQPYQFRVPRAHSGKECDIWSKGKDRKDGTKDDIGNW